MHTQRTMAEEEDRSQKRARGNPEVPRKHGYALCRATVTKMPNLSDDIDRRIHAGWMGFKRYKRELYDRSIGKPAASEGPDGEVRGSRSSIVRMRDMDPPEVPLRQAPDDTPQDVASNPRNLVQVAEQAHPLVQRRPSANQMREHRNNRTHEEVVVGGGATPHG